jgi:hypothetical protein
VQLIHQIWHSSDFGALPKMKLSLKVRRFEVIEDVQKNVMVVKVIP